MYNINCLIFNGAIFYILQVITAISVLGVMLWRQCELETDEQFHKFEDGIM
jgi:hypothetical protein